MWHFKVQGKRVCIYEGVFWLDTSTRKQWMFLSAALCHYLLTKPTMWLDKGTMLRAENGCFIYIRKYMYELILDYLQCSLAEKNRMVPTDFGDEMRHNMENIATLNFRSECELAHGTLNKAKKDIYL